MSYKVEILIGIQYRGKFSVGQDRIRLGRSAFHWSIIIAVSNQYHRFDVTDGIVLDPITLQDTNPDRVWVYRHNVSDTLLGIPRYLGSIQINQKPLNVSVEKLARVLDSVPMPDIRADRTQNNCVSWTVAAIRALCDAGYCQSFDLDELQDFALAHADRRLADFKNRDDPMKFPPSVNRWLRLF